MRFVSDTVRGIIIANIYLYHHDVWEADNSLESFAFVVRIEDLLAKVPSSPNPEPRYVEWKNLRSSTAMFSYHSAGEDRYRIHSRDSYVSGFRYASPIQPLAPEDSNGPRCFFICDFNPCRKTLDSLPGATAESPRPETDCPQSASETT